MLIYVSGRYSGDIDAHISIAREWAIKLWEAGHAVICPHLNTIHMEVDCKCTYDQYIAGDLVMVARCDAMFMLPGWEKSKGAVIERDYAVALSMPVFLATDGIPDLHPTEIRCPRQAKAFAEIVGKMYRTHLSKNHDYSPANILATGEIGLVTRLWDKVARLMNLTGFQIEISKQWFAAPKSPKHESIDDTLIDTAVYAVIGLLIRAGVWGR